MSNGTSLPPGYYWARLGDDDAPWEVVRVNRHPTAGHNWVRGFDNQPRPASAWIIGPRLPPPNEALRTRLFAKVEATPGVERAAPPGAIIPIAPPPSVPCYPRRGPDWLLLGVALALAAALAVGAGLAGLFTR